VKDLEHIRYDVLLALCRDDAEESSVTESCEALWSSEFDRPWLFMAMAMRIALPYPHPSRDLVRFLADVLQDAAGLSVSAHQALSAHLPALIWQLPDEAWTDVATLLVGGGHPDLSQHLLPVDGQLDVPLGDFQLPGRLLRR
jgi:hypothetical protein